MTLYLHIGMSKTGTTALQNRFFHAHPALVNVGKPDFSQHPALYDINQAIKKAGALDMALLRSKAAAALDAAAQTGKPIMWSDEVLSNRSDTIARNAERLGELFPGARILITVREQVDWLQSLYHVFCEKTFARTNSAPMSVDGWLDQNDALARAGQNNCLDRLRYDRLVAAYDEIFGCAQVKLMFYERLATAPAPFFAELSEFLGVAPIELCRDGASGQDARPRRRLSARRATLIAAAQHLPLGAVWSALPSGVKQIVRRRVDAGAPAAAAISASWQQRLTDIAAPANHWLSARASLDVATLGYRT